MKKHWFPVVLALAFVFAACDNPAGSNDKSLPNNPGSSDGVETLSSSYTGTKSGVTYTLVITPSKARIAVGFGYVLTVKKADSEKNSNGTIEAVNGNTLTLLPNAENA